MLLEREHCPLIPMCASCVSSALELCLQGSALCKDGGSIIGLMHDGAEVHEFLVEVLDLGSQVVQVLGVV